MAESLDTDTNLCHVEKTGIKKMTKYDYEIHY